LIATLPEASQIQGIGDYNGDGSVDLLFRDQNSGAASIWYLGWFGGDITNLARHSTRTSIWVGSFRADCKNPFRGSYSRTVNGLRFFAGSRIGFPFSFDYTGIPEFLARLRACL